MGIISLIFGVIVMVFPKILNYIIGAYLIIIGVMPLSDTSTLKNLFGGTKEGGGGIHGKNIRLFQKWLISDEVVLLADN